MCVLSAAECYGVTSRGMVDDEGEQFVGYFLPTVETKKKRKRDAEEGLEYAPGDE